MENLQRYMEELEREREKLHRLINKSKAVPIQCNESILEQSRKVDALIVKIQKANELNNKP